MALPETVRVKLSSEAAEYIALTPVLSQEMPLRELVEHMLGVTGKDDARVKELLLRGTLVSGASRFRWAGWNADRDSIRLLLTTFPDPDPSRGFSRRHCLRAILRGGRQPVDVTREAGQHRPLFSFKRTSFWDSLMEILASAQPRYRDYSYRERADVYDVYLSPAAAERIRQAARAVKYSSLREKIRASPLTAADLYVPRPEAS